MDFATSLGPIMKVNYFIKVEITLQTKFGLSQRIYNDKIPVKIMIEADENPEEVPDVTQVENQDADLLSNLLRYPRIPAPPNTTFNTKLMPGAHYKIQSEEFKLPANQNQDRLP